MQKEMRSRREEEKVEEGMRGLGVLASGSKGVKW